MRYYSPRLFVVTALAVAAFFVQASGRPSQLAPTGFIPNQGQFLDQEGRPNEAVAFLFEGNDLQVQLRQGGFSYDSRRPVEDPGTDPMEGRMLPELFRLHRIDVQLEGSDPQARWEAFGPSADVLNYYTTNTGEAGITGVHHYERVVCRDIYPGIDLEFRITGDGSAKYDFIVHPGSDPQHIRLRYMGAKAQLDQAAVKLTWADGTLHDRMPRSYWCGALEEEAAVSLVQVEADLFTYALKGERRNDRALVIDPVPDLQWGTYYGNGDHRGSLNGLALDPNGNTVAVGTAGLAGLASSGAHDQVLSGTQDALIVKLNSAGQRVWATYFGGSNNELGKAVALDANGVIHITGTTWSTTAIATTGAHQTQLSGTTDAFLAKFSASGTRLWSTYYGGSGDEDGNAIVVDGAGEPAIAGNTASSSGIASAGGADSYYGGSGDAFLVKFYASGVREWATYLGGLGADNGMGLGCDNTYFFLCGSTSSASGIALGATHKPALDNIGMPPLDSYLVKYSGLGQKMWGTYFGGTSGDFALTCSAELLTGDVYIAGRTTSVNGIASPGAHQANFQGSGDAFLAKFNYMGLRHWSTYLGGMYGDVINAVALGSYGRVYAAGTSDSPSYIATAGSAQPTLAGVADAFVNCFSSSGNRLWGTYCGGAGYDNAYAMGVSGLDLVVGGMTGSTSGIATLGTFQSTAAVSESSYAKYVVRFRSSLFLPARSGEVEEAPSSLPVSVDAEGFRVMLPPEWMTTGDGTLSVRVVDVMGRTVLADRRRIEGAVWSFSWPNCAAGTYAVVIEAADERRVGRLVKP